MQLTQQQLRSGVRPSTSSRRTLVVRNVAEVQRAVSSGVKARVRTGQHHPEPARSTAGCWTSSHIHSVTDDSLLYSLYCCVLQGGVPEGTPVVPPLVSHVDASAVAADCVTQHAIPQQHTLMPHQCCYMLPVQDLPSRPRRNRRSESFRKAVREQIVSPANFILPIFVHEEGTQNIPIASMPGIYRLAYGKNVVEHVAQARAVGVNQVVVFPKVQSDRPAGSGSMHALLDACMHACLIESAWAWHRCQHYCAPTDDQMALCAPCMCVQQ